MSDAASLLGATPADPAPAPSDPTPSPPAPGGETPPAAWDWGKFAKDEDLGWLQSKQYSDVPALIKAARSSEKLIGHDKVPLPKDANDVDGQKRVWSKMGWPEKIEDYQLELPEGADKSFVDRMVNKMHANGASTKLVKEIFKDYLEFGRDQQKAQTAALQAQHAREQDALKVEWGAAVNQQVQIAQMGIDAFCGEGMLDKFKAALGPAETLRFFAKLGGELREAKRVDGDGGGFGPMTPAQAKYEISQKRLDKAFMDAYLDGNHHGHAAAVQEMVRLQKYAAPE